MEDKKFHFDGAKKYKFNKKGLWEKKEVQTLTKILVVLILGGIIGSTATGFLVLPSEKLDPIEVCQGNLAEIEKQGKEMAASLESSNNLNKELADKLSGYSLAIAKHNETVNELKEKLELMKNDLESKQINLSSTESDLAVIREEIGETKEKLENAQTDFKELVQNYANRFCCQLNFLGFNYQYYDVINNDVVCLTSGTKLVDCER